MAPPKLKALSIIAIVLGALGLLGAFSGALAFVAGPEKMQSMAATPGQPPEVAEVQQAMNKALIAISNDWKTYNGLIIAATFFVAGALLAGGIMSHRLREQGRQILQITFLVAIPFEVLQGVASVGIGLATREVMREFMPQMMRATTPAGSPVPEAAMEGMASGITEMAALVGIAFSVGWILMKISFYGVGSLYLRKPDVRALFKP